MSKPNHSISLMSMHAAFPVAVEVTREDQKNFYELLSRVCERYEASHPGRVMWVGGWGALPGCGEDDRLTAHIMEREEHRRERTDDEQ